MIPSTVLGTKQALRTFVERRKEGREGEREGGRKEGRKERRKEGRKKGIRNYSAAWTLNLEVQPRFERKLANPIMSQKVSVTPERAG